MTAFRDALLITLLIISALGAEQMINTQAFAEIFGKAPPCSQWTDDFMKGQMDCHEGKPHKQGKSAAYDSGYATQYEMEQVKGVMR